VSQSHELQFPALAPAALMPELAVSTPPRARWPARLQQRLWGAMRWLSAGGVFLMMVVAFVDVVGRKFLDQPLRGSVELTELLMLMVVFIGVALVSHDRNHVQLDLLDSAVPVRWQALRERAGEFLSGLIMLGAGWLALTRALQAGREGELTALLRISMAPAFAIVAVLLAIAAVAHFVLALAPAAADQGTAP
jgi:TRAP-type C4-dicarboxylate transport system permease small subunit